MRNLLVLALALALVPTLTSCAGRSLVKGQRTVVERSASKPDWVEKRSWEEDGKFFVVGTSGSVQDISVGEEIAEMNGKKLIASAVSETIRRQFDAATTGNPNAERLGRAMTSVLSQRTDRVAVRGILPVERYWERYEVVTDDGVAPGVEVSLKLAVTKVDFEAAKRQELQAIAQQEQFRLDADARRLVDQMRAQP
jgi:hypothetical protein